MKVKLDPFRLALFLLMIITVSRIHQHFSIIAKFRPALLLVALTGLYAFLNPRSLELGGVFRTWPPRVVAALGLLACFGAPFGISLGASARFILEEYSKTIVLCFLLVLAIRNARDLYALVWAYVISSGILVWMALFVFDLSKAASSHTARLSNLYSFDANDIGCVLMIGLALSLLTFQVSRGWQKVASAVIILGIGAALARSGSRGAFVGLAVFGVALVVMLRSIPLSKRLSFVGVTIVMLAVAAPPGYWEQMSTLTSPTEDYNWDRPNGRRAVAMRGIGYMMSYPIFGLGVGNFDRAECMISIKARQHIAGTGLRCTPPHNSFLQAGAELGIPGLILWCTLVFGGIISMARLQKRLPRRWLRGDPEERFLYQCSLYLSVAMVGFAATAVFLSFAWLDMVYILAAFMAGLYVSVAKKLRETGESVAIPGLTPPRSRQPRGKLPSQLAPRPR